MTELLLFVGCASLAYYLWAFEYIAPRTGNKSGN